MKLILMSGGAGTRLWPLSNNSRSKQFLKLLTNKNGQLESMLQRICNQLEVAGLANSTVIMTNKSHVDMFNNQIGNKFPLIIEPERRDTFPAISLATAYLHSVNSIDPDEVVVVVPTDIYVEDSFFKKIKELKDVILNTGDNLALIGVTPTIPSEQYGYIIPDLQKHEGRYLKVNSFQEKPTKVIAKKLITQQAFWNSGVFAFKLGFLLNLLKERNLPTAYNQLLNSYDLLAKNSFDYEIVENTKNIAMLPYNGYWRDLGTWESLTEQLESSCIGTKIISSNCKTTHVINELGIPITVMGLSNTIVAVSPDGILVAEKSSNSKIKDVIKDFYCRPMFEERRWGTYKVLDYVKLADGSHNLTKRINIMAGKNLSYQLHRKRSEIWTIISGKGIFALNDILFPVKSGDVLKIPLGYKHGIKALTDMEIIEVQIGTDLVEEDIVRIFMNWEDIEQHCIKQVVLLQTSVLNSQ
ncbi:mannose-1-phosphate guanylyltransferase [Bacillus cereus]|uniref:sugar phosphate nucleotidyltransferase n=1 Tax=Bacillus cereus TaxID=1396 RepID=UPI000BFCE0DA|nr:sugar phosphate nucleotidyltransferase [Bacillus cereus]PGU00842.1 mannose-1-phosphate guanylyltransferase [Bacillus cereus]